MQSLDKFYVMLCSFPLLSRVRSAFLPERGFIQFPEQRAKDTPHYTFPAIIIKYSENN